MLVTQAGRTRSNDLREVTLALEQVGANIIGVVVNRVNFGRAEYRRREYYTTYYNVDYDTANSGALAEQQTPKRRWFGLSRG